MLVTTRGLSFYSFLLLPLQLMNSPVGVMLSDFAMWRLTFLSRVIANTEDTEIKWGQLPNSTQQRSLRDLSNILMMPYFGCLAPFSVNTKHRTAQHTSLARRSDTRLQTQHNESGDADWDILASEKISIGESSLELEGLALWPVSFDCETLHKSHNTCLAWRLQ